MRLALLEVLLQDPLGLQELLSSVLPVAHYVKVEGTVVLDTEFHAEGSYHLTELFMCLKEGRYFKLAGESLLSQLITLHSITHLFYFLVFRGHVDALIGLEAVSKYINSVELKWLLATWEDHPINLTSVFFGAPR